MLGATGSVRRDVGASGSVRRDAPTPPSVEASLLSPPMAESWGTSLLSPPMLVTLVLPEHRAATKLQQWWSRGATASPCREEVQCRQARSHSREVEQSCKRVGRDAGTRLFGIESHTLRHARQRWVGTQARASLVLSFGRRHAPLCRACPRV